MREKNIERYLVEQVKLVGGFAIKLTSPGNTGVPDRVVILPGGRTIFVELKSPTGKLSVKQQYWVRKLGDVGADVLVISSREQVDELVVEFSA